MRNKSKVFEKFQVFKSLVENHIDKNIKVPKINKGGELCQKDFDQFHKLCGIEHQNTTLDTPQRNGVVEIMNRKLMERKRACLVVSVSHENFG
jgi:hypothetical protein